MANGWIKYFADGTCSKGTDLSVITKKVSWRNGRLDSMIGVSLEYQGFLMQINGTGNYWQSDKYEATFPFKMPTLLCRRIERLIDNNDSLYRVLKEDNRLIFSFNGELNGGKASPIPADWYGKWFVIEYDVKKKSTRWYVSEKRI